MYEQDRASQGLGITISEARPGYAVAEMTITSHHLNGLDVCHGGLIFTLADTAMAFASNAGEATAFAIHADIDWIRPGLEGVTLVATATTVGGAGRLAIHDVDITGGGETIATFRGRTRTVPTKRPS